MLSDWSLCGTSPYKHVHVCVYIFRKDLGKFDYLTQCIKEVLRLHSPVFFIQRLVTTDIQLEGYKIPAGSHIALDIFNLHHNPSVWGEDGNEFKPERFSPENVDKMDPFAFLPFSAGQRYLCVMWKMYRGGHISVYS